MNILLLGGTGFIGSHVLEELIENDFDVFLMIRNVERITIRSEKLHLIETLDFSSIENIPLLKETNIDCCINLLWEDIPDFSYEKCKRNLEVGLNILEFVKQCGIKTMICFGSCWEYEASKLPLKENSSLSYSNYFKVVKHSLRGLSELFCAENQIKFYWLRLFYVYGPNQKSNSLLPYLISQFKEGNTPKLSNPKQCNDFIYVKDISKLIVKIINEKPEGTVYNVGSGEQVQNSDIYNIVAKFYGANSLENSGDISSESVGYFSNNESIYCDTSWTVETTIENGIGEMIKHYNEKKQRNSL